MKKQDFNTLAALAAVNALSEVLLTSEDQRQRYRERLKAYFLELAHEAGLELSEDFLSNVDRALAERK